MKILIGTPVHESKDYALEKWLENVVKLRQIYPTDFLMVDSSKDTGYVKKIKKRCQKIGIKNYKLEHIVIGQWQPWAEKTGRSWEVIRENLLAHNYDAWFSWECDIIIPTNTLNTLIKIMKSGNYSMVNANALRMDQPVVTETNISSCLIKRDVIEKYTFMLTPPENCWAGGEERFKKKVLAGGGSYLELYGTIKPVIHLEK